MCAWHRGRALADCWPVPGDFKALLAVCSDCRAASNRICQTDGGQYIMRAGRDLTPEQGDQWNAIHEAGHGVVGTLGGMTLGRAVIAASPDQLAPGIDREASGYVHWDDYGHAFYHRPTHWMAMVWAGYEASIRWLRESALDTSDNIIDIAHGASGDMTDLANYIRRRDLPRDHGRSLAARLVAENWDTITDVAEQLIDRRTLTGAEVRAMTAKEPIHA